MDVRRYVSDRGKVVEEIVYKGKPFKRYPEAKGRAQRTYFKYNRKLLHREIYRDYYGEIPPGYQVHHRDGNAANNNPANLELLTQQEHAVKTRQQVVPSVKTCDFCGKTFEDVSFRQNARFCCPLHGAQASYRDGEYNIEAKCVECGKRFETWRYNTILTCSRNCRNKLSGRKIALFYSQAGSAKENGNTCQNCGVVFCTLAGRPAKWCSPHCRENGRLPAKAAIRESRRI